MPGSDTVRYAHKRVTTVRLKTNKIIQTLSNKAMLTFQLCLLIQAAWQFAHMPRLADSDGGWGARRCRCRISKHGRRSKIVNIEC